MNIRILLISLFVFIISSCSLNSDVNEPVDLLWDKLGEKSNSLIIFLPGLYDTAEVFKKKQFFTIARESGIKADLVAASIHVDHLLQGKLIADGSASEVAKNKTVIEAYLGKGAK